MLALALALQQRDRVLRAQELPGQVDGERALPVGERDVFARRRRARDAGVVDERVEAAQLGLHGLEEARHGGRVRHVADAAGEIRARSSASASSAASSTSQTCTRAPSRANARAVARPMPEAPAVTSTRRPRMFRSIAPRCHEQVEANRALQALHYNCERRGARMNGGASRARHARIVNRRRRNHERIDEPRPPRRPQGRCRGRGAGRAGISRDQPRPGGGDPHRAPDAADRISRAARRVRGDGRQSRGRRDQRGAAASWAARSS